MAKYEYRVIPAPNRGVKAKGVKTPEARFSHALEGVMNEMAADGWEYQRAEALPSVERSGLTSTTTTWRNVLVFRKPIVDAATTAVMVEAPGDRTDLDVAEPAAEDVATQSSEVPEGAKSPPSPEALSATLNAEKSSQ